jgi:hypothetical protein
MKSEARTIPGSLSLRVLGLGLLVALALPAFGQMAADSLFNGFKPEGQFIFELGGEDLKHAEIFHSANSGAYLIMAPELSSPLLVNPRSRAVESVHIMKVAKRDDGTVDLLADAGLTPMGRYRIEANQLVFDVGEKVAKLKQKPALVGLKSLEEVLSHKPEYGRNAAGYSPNKDVVKALARQSQPVRVRTYFGTWCPTCTRVMPNILKLNQILADTANNIQFEYYGLPKGFTGNKEAEANNIKGVPTGIVYVGEVEVGRIQTGDWNSVEVTINRILAKAK